MDFKDKLRLNAVEAIIGVDGWCEKLPDSNCRNCPILCFVDDSNEVIRKKAEKWKQELFSQEEAKA